jgi:deoxyribose-phosphate aldolase
VEDVRQIRSLVGDRIRIKASGGIRSLGVLLEMHNAGATRFGVNLASGIEIADEALMLEAGIRT